MDLQKGDKAPLFTTKDQNGNKVALKDFSGQKVILYFYPEDDTPTCTVEACNLRDNYAALKAKGIAVLGVSPDDVEKHSNFTKKYELPFTLLADVDKEIANKYGTWGEKNLYGKKYMGIKRFTFLINEDGTIHHIIKRVRAKEHATQILEKWGLA